MPMALLQHHEKRTFFGRDRDMNPLKTVTGTLIAGFVLMLIIGASIGDFAFDWRQLARWLHIIAVDKV